MIFKYSKAFFAAFDCASLEFAPEPEIILLSQSFICIILISIQDYLDKQQLEVLTIEPSTGNVQNMFSLRYQRM